MRRPFGILHHRALRQLELYEVGRDVELVQRILHARYEVRVASVERGYKFPS